MAIGDQADFVTRLKAVLPPRWFPDTGPGAPSSAPILDAVTNALAWPWSQAYALLAYVKAQSRIGTATDVFLDMISRDFFAGALPRIGTESDGSFRTRIKARMFRHVATREAIINALLAVSGPGPAPTIIEPWNPNDCGAWCDASDGGNGVMAWDTAGAWGDLNIPGQFFVHAYSDFIGTDLGQPAVLAAITSVKAEGTAAWFTIN